MLGSPSFGITKTLDCSFEEAVERVTGTLKTQGFGVLTKIDMTATIKKKLGKEMPPYLILGACHPQSAYSAWQAEAAIGLLLPCNVVVTVNEHGKAVVGAIDPKAMFSVVQNDNMNDLVEEVKSALTAAINAC